MKNLHTFFFNSNEFCALMNFLCLLDIEPDGWLSFVLFLSILMGCRIAVIKSFQQRWSFEIQCLFNEQCLNSVHTIFKWTFIYQKLNWKILAIEKSFLLQTLPWFIFNVCIVFIQHRLIAYVTNKLRVISVDSLLFAMHFIQFVWGLHFSCKKTEHHMFCVSFEIH